jgi:hypothetical protein
MAKHLVKKSTAYVDEGLIIAKRGISSYCETRVNGSPSGSRLSLGDTLYIAEAGYAIVSVGEVAEPPLISQVRSLEELFKYISSSNIKQEKYWFSIAMEKIYKRKDFKFLNILEYKIYSEPLSVPVPLCGMFNKQSSWYYLPDNFILPIDPPSLQLSSNIPQSLRLKLYYSMSLNVDKNYIDIDHFVPKSIGGPGNIEENLHLVSSSINRRKSDSLPVGLYVAAKEFNICVAGLADVYLSAQILLHQKSKLFFSDSEHRRVARDIVNTVNSLEIIEVRKFYQRVKELHGL